MHAEALAWCEKWQSPQTGIALDLGGRNVNGHARGFWPNMTWTVLDLHGDPDNHLDRVIEADARTWTPDRRYDLVLSTELLEHVNPWWLCVATMVEALAPGGLLVITCAGPGRAPHGMHGDERPAEGEHYANVPPDALYQHLRNVWGLNEVMVQALGGDVRAIADRLP